MIYELPKPKSPEIFENLVCDLSNALYKTTSFSLYGRKGQSQKGVDIVSPSLNIVIQCKLRTLNLSRKATKIKFINEVIKDINNIIHSGFRPKKIIVATTLESDTVIQDYLNTTLLFNNIGCALELWSWTKISNEIFLFPAIVNKYYAYRNNNIEIARIEVLNKSVYRKSEENEKLYSYTNVKNRNHLPIFDISFINNSDDTILLNSIECFCATLAIGRAGFLPKSNGILKPTKKFLIEFEFIGPGRISKQTVELKDPIYVSPKSPLRIQIQNAKPIINFHKISFVFKFNNTDIQIPELFFNSANDYSGNIVTRI